MDFMANFLGYMNIVDCGNCLRTFVCQGLRFYKGLDVANAAGKKNLMVAQE